MNLLSIYSVESHDDHWNHGGNQSARHVCGWAVSALHTNLNVVKFHLEIHRGNMIIHASVHIILLSISWISHKSTYAAHFIERFTSAISGLCALFGLWTKWNTGHIHSIQEVFVKFDSVGKLLTFAVSALVVCSRCFITISHDWHGIVISGHVASQLVIIKARVHCLHIIQIGIHSMSHNSGIHFLMSCAIHTDPHFVISVHFKAGWPIHSIHVQVSIHSIDTNIVFHMLHVFHSSLESYISDSCIHLSFIVRAISVALSIYGN